MKKLDIYSCNDAFASSNEIMELVAKKTDIWRY
nr:MAG TPA: S-adenosylmethionine decarboxylase [Bacteriophage sp.]